MDPMPDQSLVLSMTKSEEGNVAVTGLLFVHRPTQSIPLRFPFKLGESLVDAVTIRRLTTADLIHLAQTDGDLFDAYALMTDLAADILRGLDAEDGDQVTAAAHALLPPLLKAGPRPA